MNGWATRLLLLWVACAVSYFIPHSVSAATRIRIGYSAITTTQAPLWAAEDRGLFKKYGLETERIYLLDVKEQLKAKPSKNSSGCSEWGGIKKQSQRRRAWQITK